MPQHEPGPGEREGGPGREAPVLRWAVPTRGYVLATAVTVLITNGAIAAWQVASLAAPDGSQARGGGWLSVTAVVVVVLGVVAVVDRARRPRPWSPDPRGSTGVRQRVQDCQARDAEERRVLRRAVWCGVLPRRRRLQRIAARRLATRVSATAGFLWMTTMLAGFVFGVGSRGGFAPPDTWLAALPGLAYTLLAAAVLGQDRWLCSRAVLLVENADARSRAECRERGLEPLPETGASTG